MVRALGANCHASGFDASQRRTAHPCHEAGTGPSGSGHTLPGEAGPLSDRPQGMTREAGNPGLPKKKKIYAFLYYLLGFLQD